MSKKESVKDRNGVKIKRKGGRAIEREEFKVARPPRRLRGKSQERFKKRSISGVKRRRMGASLVRFRTIGATASWTYSSQLHPQGWGQNKGGHLNVLCDVQGKRENASWQKESSSFISSSSAN